MIRSTAAALLGVLLVLGCGHSARRAGPGAEAGDAHPSRLQVLMREKLEHSRDIMAGLALGNFRLIESNAENLHAISLEAAWQITDSVTYAVYSDEFRTIAQDLAGHARAEDLEAASADFAELTRTCVTCHTWLRRERLTGEFPERVSRADPSSELFGVPSRHGP